AGYRLRKVARRYRTPLSVAGAFLVLLVVGVVFSVWQSVRARSAENAAVLAERQTRKALDETQDARDETAKALAESQEYAKRLKEEKEASERLRYVSDIRLAQHAADQNDFDRLQDLLASHRPHRAGDIDLRGFEWYYLD